MKRFILLFGLMVVLVGCSFGGNPTTTPQTGNTTPTLPAVQTVAVATNIPTAPPANPTATQPQTQATATQAAQATPTTGIVKQITLSEPTDGATIGKTFKLVGKATYAPFEKNFAVEIVDANGASLHKQGMIVSGEYGGPTTFDETINWNAPNGGDGKIRVAEYSANDGSLVTKAEVAVKFVVQQGEQQTITISSPATDASVGATINFTGNASYTPFEKQLGAQVYDSEGNLIGQDSLFVEGEYGSSSTFNGSIKYTQPATTRPGKLVVYDVSPQDGSVTSQAEVKVMLQGYTGNDPYINLPAENATVSLPIHVEASRITPQNVIVRLVFADGTVLEQNTTKLNNSVVENLDWATESAPPNPPSQQATLEIANAANGKTITSRPVNLVNRSDTSLLMPIKLYWLAGEDLQEVTRYVPRSSSVATAALRELSWGPAGNESAAAGFTTALATPSEVSKYGGRQADWSNRAYLKSIKIENGTAYLDWSAEMAAWGGGSARLGMLTQQVTKTLQQFSTIKNVKMTVNGSEDALQP